MDNAVTIAEHADHSPSVDITVAIDSLVSRWDHLPRTPRMHFFAQSVDGTVIEAVVLWPTSSPLLADVATLFDHFGLRVADREGVLLPTDFDSTATLHKFTFEPIAGWRASALPRVSEAFEAHWVHGSEIDGFCALVLRSDLSWRDVLLVRAASRFTRQAGLQLSESYILDTLLRHTDFSPALVQYFHARFDPDLNATWSERKSLIEVAQSRLRDKVDTATTLDDDRIMQALYSFVSACLRTNWYQITFAGTPKPHAAFKLDSSKLAITGPVIPYREIYIYAADVEGVHLRSGPVARGGLRFSDRAEDYRTEVLGLLKTQAVKNSPIVPGGAKGAFVRKNPDITPTEAYTTFIRGLLDITDNTVDGQTVSPARTVLHDDSDTYLVVAADKGTSSLSDVANSIATEDGYWLGDAFASGGSSGYDHKAMGITARGAWVSVRRHLQELGVDIYTDPVTVAGIGDMSGDVFGNGMLLSESIRLVAAFDHRHIFIDPDPDPTRSYAERSRLFRLRGSTWDDFDRSVLSAGSGIWPRSAKRIPLSPQARELLGLQSNSATPTDVIQAILTAEIDVLWNGGIGTYVKASDETHADAADPVNDAVRIDAAQLRARVIGEGGNLGLTQRARIEYALGGGAINADFIDNAAGVATSDREVNIKIALDVAVRNELITRRRRDDLLSGSRESVANAVLSNCESQALAISLAASKAPRLVNRHERLIDNLEHHNGISRITEVLPNKTLLASRTRAGLGLTRPEIAVLLAQSKNAVQQDLLNSTVPDEPAFAPILADYFPPPVRDEVPAEIAGHQLAREIIATKIADDLINHVGPGLIYQFDERMSVKTPAVARAYAAAWAVFDVAAMWSEAETRDDLTEVERWRLLHALQQFIEHTASWILRHRPSPLDVESEIARYRPGVTGLLHGRRRPITIDEIADHLRLLGEAFDLIETARHTGCSLKTAVDVYCRSDSDLDLTWLFGRLDDHATANWWETMAAAAVRDDLAGQHHALVRAIISLEPLGDNVITAWTECSGDAIGRFTSIVAELRRDGVVNIAQAMTARAELELLVRTTRAAGTNLQVTPS